MVPVAGFRIVGIVAMGFLGEAAAGSGCVRTVRIRVDAVDRRYRAAVAGVVCQVPARRIVALIRLAVAIHPVAMTAAADRMPVVIVAAFR